MTSTTHSSPTSRLLGSAVCGLMCGVTRALCRRRSSSKRSRTTRRHKCARFSALSSPTAAAQLPLLLPPLPLSLSPFSHPLHLQASKIHILRQTWKSRVYDAAPSRSTPPSHCAPVSALRDPLAAPFSSCTASTAASSPPCASATSPGATPAPAPAPAFSDRLTAAGSRSTLRTTRRTGRWCTACSTSSCTSRRLSL